MMQTQLNHTYNTQRLLIDSLILGVAQHYSGDLTPKGIKTLCVAANKFPDSTSCEKILVAIQKIYAARYLIAAAQGVPLTFEVKQITDCFISGAEHLHQSENTPKAIKALVAYAEKFSDPALRERIAALIQRIFAEKYLSQSRLNLLTPAVNNQAVIEASTPPLPPAIPAVIAPPPPGSNATPAQPATSLERMSTLVISDVYRNAKNEESRLKNLHYTEWVAFERIKRGLELKLSDLSKRRKQAATVYMSLKQQLEQQRQTAPELPANSSAVSNSVPMTTGQERGPENQS